MEKNSKADSTIKWILGEKHKLYGKVVGMGIRDGEPYRFFIKDGVVSLIPLELLKDDK